MNEENVFNTNEWQLYEKGKNFLRKKGIYDETDKVYRFFNGDQWQGVKSGVIQPITYNIIKPIIKYKIGVIQSNGYSIVFSPNNFDDERFQIEMTELCEQINEYISILWEKKKIESFTRNILKDACINGEGIIYINYNMLENEIEPELIDKNNIIYENENTSNINEQEYILIANRKSLEAVRREAREKMEAGLNSLTEEDIRNIQPDENTMENPGDYAKDESGIMTPVISKFFRKGDTIWFKKSTKTCVIEDERDLGLKKYPIAHYIWEEVKGSARGTGEVIHLIPNQIEINKTATRRALSVMQTAYPKLVVNRKKITNASDITKVGTAIYTEDNTVDDVRTVASYLVPTSMSSDSQILQDELINNSRDLAGAGDTLTGNVNPERASGQAILAVQQSGEQVLTEQLIRFKDFLEDIGSIVFEMWKVYTPEEGKKIIVKESLQNLEDKPENNVPYQEGYNPYVQRQAQGEIEESFDDKIVDSNIGYGQDLMEVEDNAKDLEDKEVFISKVIPLEIIEKLEVNIKIDVSPNTPFDKYAREQSLENLMTNQIISFEEYAKYLPADSSMPKDILTNILKDRRDTQAKINQVEQAAIQKKSEMEQMTNEAELQSEQMNPEMQQPQLPQGDGEFYN